MEPARLGRYRDLVLLGEGGMGKVYLAHAEGPDGFSKPVVLKRMHEELARQPGFVERFLKEAKTQANLVCSSIVQVLDFGRLDETYFLVLEHVHGSDLAKILRKANGPLPVGAAVRIAAEVCRGLDFAHRARLPDGSSGIVHRDVSPQNVLISFEGDVKLGDFGIVKTGPGESAEPAVMYGKPSFMAPEQVRGEAVDARSDLYALGTVLYFSLTGSPPFRGGDRMQTLERILEGKVEPVEDLRPDVPPAVAAVVARSMRSDPAERFPDAAAMLLALEEEVLSLGGAATTRAVRDSVRALFPGAAERDAWEREPNRPVLQLDRLVADDGSTVLTTKSVTLPERPSPPEPRARAIGAPRKWLWLAVGLASLGAILGISLTGGSSRESARRGRSVTDREATPPAKPPRAEVAAKAQPDRVELADDALRAERGGAAVNVQPAGQPRRMEGRGDTGPRRSSGEAPEGKTAAASPDATGILRVGVSPGWGWVWVDGRRVGSTPVETEVAAGRHRVRVVSGRTGHQVTQSVHVGRSATRALLLESFE